MTVGSITTARLQGEPVTMADLDDARRLQQDERYMRYMGGSRDEAGTVAWIHRQVAHWDDHGFGMWFLRDRVTGELAGGGGMRHSDYERIADVAIGYGLIPRLWGRGLATEIAEACLATAIEELSLTTVVAAAHPDNAASIRVLQKTGFVFERNLMTEDGPGVLYRWTQKSG
jgi:RimJ/RimL family protein N-acetyltransferase